MTPNQRSPAALRLAAVVQKDDFLAHAGTPPAPGDELATQYPLSLAQMDVGQAQEAVFLVPADEVGGRFVLASEVVAALRGELQAFMHFLKEKGSLVTELLSSSTRDQAIRKMTQALLDAAYNAPSRSWMTPLPTGRQIVIAPSELVESVGFETICRVAHERAIRTAQASGLPYNTQALAHYQSTRPMETA